MSFLKIDKKNISTFSKVILVMVFVVLFTFGFANKTFGSVATGIPTPATGLPDGITLNPNASDQGRSVFIANPNYDPNASFLSANSQKTINASGGQYSGSVYLGSDGKFYLAEIDPKSIGNLTSLPVIKDYVEVTPVTDQYGRIEIMKDVWIQKSDYTINNPSTATPISATLDSNLISGANGGTYTYMGIDTSNPNVQVWKDSNGNLMSLDTGAKTQSLQNYTGNSYNNNLPTTTFNNALINGTQNTTVTKNSSGNFQADKNPNNGICWGGGATIPDLRNCFYQGLYYVIFWPISWLLGMAGWLFNVVFDTTVINMSGGINKIGAIDVAWKTMRDLANIGFIFILLYLAISTIIGAGEHDVKKTLSKLIMVAILLNFSLFFTKIIIDSSNILAISFYKAIVVNGSSGNNTAAGSASGMGDAFMGAFRLQTLFQDPSTSTLSKDSGQAFAAGNQHMSVLIGGSITMLVAIVILLASLMMFLKRYIILILVMIFSPVAFAGMVLHQTEHSVQSWWNYLLKEAFFAPVYMIMLWISFTIINDKGFLQAIGEGDGSTDRNSITTTQSASFEATENGQTGSPSAAGVLIDFMIVSALLISSLIVAEKMGVSGASGAMNFAKGAQGGLQGGLAGIGGWIGSNTLGRAANTLGNKGKTSTWLQDAQSGKVGNNAFQRFAFRQVGRAGLGITSGLSSAKFGGQVSGDDAVKKRAAEFKAYLDEHHHSADAYAHVMKMGADDPLGNLGNDKKAAHDAIHGMSEGQLADAAISLGNDPKGAAALNMMKSRLTPEMKRKMEAAINAGRPGNISDITKDYSDEKWKSMTDGQRKYVMENMNKEEAGAMESHFKQMMDVMKENDIASIEALNKSQKADPRVKSIAHQITGDSAIRANMKAAYDKADAEQKTILAEEFTNNGYGNISTAVISSSDEALAELYNKNANRYVQLTPEQESAKKLTKIAVDLTAKAKKAEEIAEAKEAHAEAVTGMATEVLAAAKKML